MTNLLVWVLALLVSHLPQARAADPQWISGQLLGRSGHAMAYDSTRGVTVMMGGSWATPAPQPLNRYEWGTWEYIDGVWVNRTVKSPTPRVGHAMVYDSRRGVVMMFGGNGAGVPLNANAETWEWDGIAWTQRMVAGPSARTEHAMAYDSVRGVTVLFGGSTATGTSRETWEWDGHAWSLRSTIGPSATASHVMCFDTVRGVSLLHGGSSNGGRLWMWDGTSWVQGGLGSGATAHAMVFDTARGVAVVYGGVSGQSPTADTREWDGQTWTLRAVTGPLARQGHAMVFDSVRGKTVVFGGNWGYSYYRDSWEYDGTSWTVRPDNAAYPPPRAGPIMAFDSLRGTTVLAGGAQSQSFGDDVWEYTGAMWTMRSLHGLPMWGDGHAAAFDAARGVTVFTCERGTVFSTYIWDGVVWRLKSETGPERRRYHRMAYDSARGVTVLFGGASATGLLNDIWEWDGTVWTQKFPAVSPSPREPGAMAFDSARGKVVMFGGNIGGNFPNAETWEWDGENWTERLVAGPPARIDSAMAYDSTRQVMVLFGGWDGTWLGDTWEWDGDAWMRRVGEEPIARNLHGIAFDSARSRIIMVGGVLNLSLITGETNMLVNPCTETQVAPEPSGGVVCRTGELSFSIAPPDGDVLEYLWQTETSPGVWRTLGANPTPLPGGEVASVTPRSAPQVSIAIRPRAGATGGVNLPVRCVVLRSCGSVISGSALYTICSADTNCADGVTIDDLFLYINAYFTGAPAADFNGVGGVTIDDLFLYINAYFVGC